MLKYCDIMPESVEKLIEIVRVLNRYPYTSAKAVLLESLRKRRDKYIQMGCTKKKLMGVANAVLEQSSDSTIIKNYCYPKAVAKLGA
ncbi:MAG TPA: hypothetical protein VMW31_01890 [Devosiaceae bacterium]|nr:hypothetical protein [Devosiaceae bacterium]